MAVEANELDVAKVLSPDALRFFDDRRDERQAVVESLKTAKYWLVIIPGGGDPKVNKADSLDSLRSKLKKLEGKDSQVFVFGGQRLHFTTEPDRKLIMTDNNAIRISDGLPVVRRDDDPEFSVQRDGFMGDPALYELLPVKSDNDDDDDEETVTEDDFD